MYPVLNNIFRAILRSLTVKETSLDEFYIPTYFVSSLLLAESRGLTYTESKDIVGDNFECGRTRTSRAKLDAFVQHLTQK